jgi:hypothetical protein
VDYSIGANHIGTEHINLLVVPGYRVACKREIEKRREKILKLVEVEIYSYLKPI